MTLKDTDLLPGEHVLQSKAANSIITPSDYGLSRLAFDSMMGIVGMQGKEAIGGELNITNYRLVFKSHPINRLRGQFSIFLPIITEVRNTSKFITRKITISTTSAEFEFILWGIPDFIKAIESARNALKTDDVTRFQSLVTENIQKWGEGLHTVEALEHINRSLLDKQTSGDLRRRADTPLTLIAVLAYEELTHRLNE